MNTRLQTTRSSHTRKGLTVVTFFSQKVWTWTSYLGVQQHICTLRDWFCFLFSQCFYRRQITDLAKLYSSKPLVTITRLTPVFEALLHSRLSFIDYYQECTPCWLQNNRAILGVSYFTVTDWIEDNLSLSAAANSSRGKKRCDVSFLSEWHISQLHIYIHRNTELFCCCFMDLNTYRTTECC